jgi:hypothetical protein
MSISPGAMVNRVAVGKSKNCLRIVAFMKMLLKETAKILDGSFLIASNDGILPSETIKTSCSRTIIAWRTYHNTVVEPTSSYQIKS